MGTVQTVDVCRIHPETGEYEECVINADDAEAWATKDWAENDGKLKAKVEAEADAEAKKAAAATKKKTASKKTASKPAE